MVIEPPLNTDIRLGEGESLLDLEFKAWPALTARGKVLDDRTLQGIEDVQLFFRWQRPEEPKLSYGHNVGLPKISSNLDGTFVIPGLLPGRYSVILSHPRYIIRGPQELRRLVNITNAEQAEKLE